jgi:hypothetical protein
MTVDRKLRLRLELIAALPEPILLDRLRRLSQVELIAFRRRYGNSPRCAMSARAACTKADAPAKHPGKAHRPFRSRPINSWQSCWCRKERQRHIGREPGRIGTASCD